MQYTRQIEESEEEFIWRVCKDRDEIGTWQNVADILNKELGYEFTESKYRKQFNAYCNMFDKVGKKQLDKSYLQDLEDKEERLFKERVKTQDKIRELKSELRHEARYENLVDAVLECAKSMPQFYLDFCGNWDADKEAILAIGDWHLGALVDNFKQKFNIQVLTNRVAQLKEQVIYYCQKNDIRILNVLNLGDLISGNIHISGRIESEVDAVTQTIQCAELLAKFLVELGEQIEYINYRSVSDNHARITADYKEHIESENFGRIIDWYLIERLKNTNINIIKDNLDDNIGYFQLDNGKNVAFVHGHLDQVSSILQNLTFGTDIIMDYVILGHFHSSKMKEFQSRKVFLNGSLLGVDSYALNKRLFGKPSQTLLIFDGNDEIDIRINL